MNRVPDVQRIAVLRANAVGDYLFALPALVALRHTYPEARISLLGKRWHREFLEGRPGPIDEVIELPALRGITVAPDHPPEDEAAAAQAVAALRARRFDIVLQLHGGGRHSNPFVRRLQPRLCAGLRAPDAMPLDRDIPYAVWRNERLRLLEAVQLVGAQPAELAPRLALTERDRDQLAQALPADAGPLAVLQPGASDARRRWPAERFAAVGDRLAAEGARVAINGSPDEAALTAEVAACMRSPALDLGGRLALGPLAALIARARLLVSNDTGPLHLAHALGTPAVGIYWLLNLLSAGPLVAGPQRQLLSLRTRCPVCGQENLDQRCPHDACFVDDVSVEAVVEQALQAFRAAPAGRAPA